MKGNSERSLAAFNASVLCQYCCDAAYAKIKSEGGFLEGVTKLVGNTASITGNVPLIKCIVILTYIRRTASC
jgi:hypothetical protein